MRVFQEYQKFLTYAIVRPDSTTPDFLRKFNLNLKTLPIYLITSLAWGCLVAYLYDEARTFQEYSETFYALTTLASTTTALKIFEWKKTNFLG